MHSYTFVRYGRYTIGMLGLLAEGYELGVLSRSRSPSAWTVPEPTGYNSPVITTSALLLDLQVVDLSAR